MSNLICETVDHICVRSRTWSYSRTNHVWLVADAQVISNLLSNAIKFSAAGCNIYINVGFDLESVEDAGLCKA